jgi:hypothetical protein
MMRTDGAIRRAPGYITIALTAIFLVLFLLNLRAHSITLDELLAVDFVLSLFTAIGLGLIRVHRIDSRSKGAAILFAPPLIGVGLLSASGRNNTESNRR